MEKSLTTDEIIATENLLKKIDLKKIEEIISIEDIDSIPDDIPELDINTVVESYWQKFNFLL